MSIAVEKLLAKVVERSLGTATPPKLAEALRYAVLEGGARVRPKLCLAVASACGDDDPELSQGVAAAIELLHCASLVHDDLPCFDDAATRRGRPSVHCAFGEPLAVLVGDALIVAAFETLGRSAGAHPERLGPLTAHLASAAGAARGLVAGQAWESEPATELRTYHQAKTGGLFRAATTCGAMAAGGSAERWAALGDRIGEAYQVADDLRDAVCDEDELGKPPRQDQSLARPSAVAHLGVDGARARLEALIAEAVDAIPACAGALVLQELVRQQAERLMPARFRTSAA